MSVFAVLDALPKVVRRRATERIIRIRARLAARLPAHTQCERPSDRLGDRVLVATWNLRKLDPEGYGIRRRETSLYIAAILSHFDLVAIQVTRRDHDALERLRRLLSPTWQLAVTGVALGRDTSDEHLAYLYDSRRITFDGVAEEHWFPKPADGCRIHLAGAGFRCATPTGSTPFGLCTLYAYEGFPGDGSYGELDDVPEASNAGADLCRSPRAEPARRRVWSDDLPHPRLYLSDVTVDRRAEPTMRLVRARGAASAGEELALCRPSAIATLAPDAPAEIVASSAGAVSLGRRGTFNYHDLVFHDGDERKFARLMMDIYLSHLPGWVMPPKGFSPRESREVAAETARWAPYGMCGHEVKWGEMRVG